MATILKIALAFYALLVAQDVSAATPKLHLTGSLQVALKARLKQEQRDLTFTQAEQDATHRVLVEQRQRGLELQVLTPSGTLLLDRTIALGEGLEPALRLSVLLVLRALELEKELELGKIQPRTVEPKILGLSASLMSAWWPGQATPSLGFALGVHFRPPQLSSVMVGAQISLLGLPCCKQRVDGLSSQNREIMLLAQGSWGFFQWGPVSPRVLAALGVNLVQIDARPDDPDVFAGPAAPQPINRAQLSARLALAADLDFWEDLVIFRVSFGLQIRLPKLSVAPPPGYMADTLEVDILSPWLEFGARFNFL